MVKKMLTMDGNKAAAYTSYAFTEVASIYPITPSSPMAEYVDEWSAQGKKNLFGQEVKVVEMQSEAGAAGAMHGSLATGALTTSYTASQGLLLMIPNMYKMAGEFLPGVLHVSARTLAAHALCIFGDHSDVMACSQTGFAMLATGSVQEVMDLGGVAHLAAIKTKIPFLHFFDGFRTSHEQQKIEVFDYEDYRKMLDMAAVEEFRKNALNSGHPVFRGSNQNPDIFFQAREAASPFFEKVPAVVEDYLKQVSKITGRQYGLFDYYGAPDATSVVIAMGSVCETAEQAVDYLNAQGGEVGLLKVRLYRPFAIDYFLNALPKTVERIAVLDRLKTPGAPGEPLYMDVVAAFAGKKAPLIIGGRYGLGSKDTLPEDIIAVFANLNSDSPRSGFTISIVDDISNSSLPRGQKIDMLPAGTIQCKFWGLGSDGTVGANKQAVDIIGDKTDLYAQAYFDYDSKKSGGLTCSHLRFGKKPIKAPYLISNADFICCSNQAYVHTYDLLHGLKRGGIFLLNTVWDDEQLARELPADMKRYLAENEINFYAINAVEIARNLGLGNRTNMVMQAAFFKLTGVIPVEQAILALDESIVKAYGKKGQKIVDMNKEAVQAGVKQYRKVQVPAAWAQAEDEIKQPADEPDFIKNIQRPMCAARGNELPCSAFLGREDGTFPLGGSAYEKRGVASFVPMWISENCIQCNQCSLVCPHATIRPFLMTEAEAEEAGVTTLKATGKEFADYRFKIQISPLDCLGCGVCVKICPAKEKALEMRPIDEQKVLEKENWEKMISLPDRSDLVAANNIKNSQFKKPLLEFSGSCAGCMETTYARLLTQLFGSRLVIGNATGCSSIWGAPAPVIPYTTDKNGRGPAWANSLFEDNAEYAFGMALGAGKQREKIAELMRQALADGLTGDLAAAYQKWLDNYSDGEKTLKIYQEIRELLENSQHPSAMEICQRREHLVKQSFWAFGGDGWAYDIGYGGLDHVLASGEDVNIFVFDTEVYSNTGGQSSKATPTAAIAKFAASGKRTRKKDLGMMAMSYGYVYVAQIAIGADMNQTLKAIREAESYNGPSLIIAYSTCINHGIKGGMSGSVERMKKAVEAGYWHLYRYNPDLKKEGKNPFILDSKEPTASFRDFLKEEVRYTSLAIGYPQIAEELFKKTEEDARERYESYLRLSKCNI
ncbi:MAG: pyruvate:ferredoxin (flavodoxin) oxidoreductase [Clostridia bacterium]|nr:pyruvate:ferredoxin (flavodoxin) oxidoreductase [Clostridia bacterium]